MGATTRRQLWLGLTAAVAAVTLGVLAALHLGRPRASPPPEIGGYVLPETRPLPDVTLTDGNGDPFTAEDFEGHWSLLYFGYTYCPDVCPLALIELSEVKKLLATELRGVPIAYYLVSVDPARDTPERLREYVAYFDPSFRGLTGPIDDLRRLAEHTGTVFFVAEGQGPDNYLVSHSSNIIVLDPAGRHVATITPPHEPAGIAADLATIAAHHRAAER